MQRFLLICSCFFSFAICHSQVLIRNAQVVDVENKKLLNGYDVWLRDGRIAAIEKTKAGSAPVGIELIDATGKYLIPGLIDAHVHFFQSGGMYARPDAIDLRTYKPYAQELKWVHDHMEDFLRRYTRAGITSVIDVGASMNFLRQRDTFVTKAYAPVISMTGPLLTTWVPDPYKNLGDDSPFELMKTEEDTRKAVQDQVTAGADFIKIWYIVLDADTEKGARVNLPLIKAAIEEAHRLGKRVAVHAQEEITAQLAVEAGADFLVHNIEDRVVSDAFLKLLKDRKTVLCPTMVVAGNYAKSLGDTYRFSTDELDLAHPVTIASHLDYPWPDTLLARRYIKSLASQKAINEQRRIDSVLLINLQKLYKAGVLLATGTDAGNTGTQHVGSYMDELRMMQKAGISNWDLLKASTLHAAMATGMQDSLGSIKAGKKANLVLLKANPLDSLANWRKIDRVINKGKVFVPDSLLDSTPEMLAQQQLNAYNAHDLEGFLATYAEDVEIYDFPGKLVTKGKEAMRTQYAFLKTTPNLYCKLLKRIVQGNMVIDHEEIWGAGPQLYYAVAIYIIEKGKISKVYFPQ